MKTLVSEPLRNNLKDIWLNVYQIPKPLPCADIADKIASQPLAPKILWLTIMLLYSSKLENVVADYYATIQELQLEVALSYHCMSLSLTFDSEVKSI